MLYLGHFSFEPPESGAYIDSTELGRGWFTCLAEADSADDAIEKFRNLIISLADSSDAFEHVGDIYFETAIEVRKLPEEGVLARFEQSTDGDLEGSISTVLPGYSGEGCAAFDWGKEGIYEDGYSPEPFIYYEEE